MLAHFSPRSFPPRKPFMAASSVTEAGLSPSRPSPARLLPGEPLAQGLSPANLAAPPSAALRTAFWIVVAATTAFAAFVLPFLVPMKVPVFSPAYSAGCNNRVGAIAVALVSVLVALACWLFHLVGPLAAPSPQDQTRNPLPLRYLGLAGGILVAFNGVFGLLLVRSGAFYMDAGYFITQLRSGLIFHRAIYRDFEFAYGPLLYLWPEAFIRALAHFGGTLASGYVVSLVAMELLGAALLFYTINALPLSRAARVVALLMLASFALNPQLGLNYTPLRFILPSAGIVLLSRQASLARAAAVAALVELIQAATSPELGVAFACAALAYAVYRAAVARRPAMLLIGAAALLGGVAFAALAPPGYFRAMREFANGGYNEILEPAPHIYALLLCAVALAPIAVVSAMRRASQTSSPAAVQTAALIVAIFVAGIAMLAPALGRCDPLHVSFNGMGLYLLGFVTLDRLPTRWKAVSALCASLVCCYILAQEYALFQAPRHLVVHNLSDPYDPPYLPGLEAAIGHAKVTYPWGAPLPMRLTDWLTRTGQFQPGYLCIPAMDSAADQRTIADTRSAEFALVPEGRPLTNGDVIEGGGLRYLMRFGYRYRRRNTPFIQGTALLVELQRNWVKVGTFGNYALYRKLR